MALGRPELDHSGCEDVTAPAAFMIERRANAWRQLLRQRYFINSRVPRLQTCKIATCASSRIQGFVANFIGLKGMLVDSRNA